MILPRQGEVAPKVTEGEVTEQRYCVPPPPSGESQPPPPGGGGLKAGISGMILGGGTGYLHHPGGGRGPVGGRR
jgi:hypothetical protein